MALVCDDESTTDHLYIHSVWEFVIDGVDSLPTEVLIEVMGSGVLVMGCGIRLCNFSIRTLLN